jgi:hypothetical protein
MLMIFMCCYICFTNYYQQNQNQLPTGSSFTFYIKVHACTHKTFNKFIIYLRQVFTQNAGALCHQHCSQLTLLHGCRTKNNYIQASRSMTLTWFSKKIGQIGPDITGRHTHSDRSITYIRGAELTKVVCFL